MFTQFYVLGPRGDSIISRNLRTELTRSTVEIFFRNVRFWDNKTQDAPPIFNVDGIHYMWVKRSGLYFVLTAIENTSPSLGLELLVRITKLLKDYCGILTEESVRANFILIYEVLDEVLDYGYPQSTTNDTLKAFVFNEPVVMIKDGFKNPFASTKTTSALSAHKSILHPNSTKPGSTGNNNVYIDIFEKLNVTFDSSGVIRYHSIDGSIFMKSFLTSHPELQLTMNNVCTTHPVPNAIVVDDCNFHECVNSDEFDEHQVLLFSPPEGEFNFMNYRISQEFKPPIRVFPYFEMPSAHRVEFVLKLRTDITTSCNATNVVVYIPVPSIVSSMSCETSTHSNIAQTTEYDSTNPQQKHILWKIPKFAGGMEVTLRCRGTLLSASDAKIRRHFGPIHINFDIPMYSSSNIQVAKITAVNTRVEPTKWVRYISKSNSYTVRM